MSKILRVNKTKVLTMNKSKKLGIALASLALAGFAGYSFANDEQTDTQGSVYHDSPRVHHAGSGRHHGGAKGRHSARKIVKEYIAEKSAGGELDTYEFDVRAEKLTVLREELKAAREIQDRTTVQAKREEMRTLHEEGRAATRELIQNNEDLQERIRVHQEQRREKRKMHHEDMKEFREFQEKKRQQEAENSQ